MGADAYLNRPEAGAPAAAWDSYLHLRDNPAGVTKDLWYHETGCTSWLVVTRNTVTHEVLDVALASDVKGARP
jgi:sarcosine oxidase subunit delta